MKIKNKINPYVGLTYKQYHELFEKWHQFLDANLVNGVEIDAGVDLLSQILNSTHVLIKKRTYNKICKLLKIKKGDLND